MTDPRQTEREQQAREWLEEYRKKVILFGAGSYVANIDVDSLVSLLKATEAAALEEAASNYRSYACGVGGDPFHDWLLYQIKERRS